MKLGEIVVRMGNFIKFHQNQMENKQVLLIAHFSVQNIKVSVSLWKSYIVHIVQHSAASRVPFYKRAFYWNSSTSFAYRWYGPSTTSFSWHSPNPMMIRGILNLILVKTEEDLLNLLLCSSFEFVCVVYFWACPTFEAYVLPTLVMSTLLSICILTRDAIAILNVATCRAMINQRWKRQKFVLVFCVCFLVMFTFL